MVLQDGDTLFGLRVNPVDQHRGHAAVMRQHALQLNEGRRADNLGVALQLLCQRAPIIDGLITVDGRMRDHAQDAGSQLAIKTIHHRQHQDHDHDAERQAQHGDQ